jgi:hypothetical protein
MDNTKSTALLLASCALGLGFAAQSALADDDDHHRVRATLSGFNEVHFATTTIPVPSTTPGTNVNVLNSAAIRGAVSTKARGTFRATIDKGGESITYRLSYRDLEGAVTQAHIHFGQPHTVGGIVVWLCQTAGTPAPDAVAKLTPICPPEGTVEGTITPAQVLAQTLQGFVAGEFEELVRAIRAGATYANVHSVLHPPGEIRGQIGDRD